MKKFNQLYNKIITQGRYGMTYHGNSDYSQEKTNSFPVYYSDRSQAAGINSDGSQTKNERGETQYWRILASDYPKIKNYLTGKTIPMQPSLCLKWHDNNPTLIQVPIRDYENAYANGDEETIKKLQDIGLNEGLRLN